MAVFLEAEPPIPKEYLPLPRVIDVWKDLNIRKGKQEFINSNNFLLACAHEIEFHETNAYALSIKLRGSSKIEYVTGGFEQGKDRFRDIPTQYIHYKWGNFFLYLNYRANKYQSLKLIDKSIFTHCFSFLPGLPRLHRCKMIELLAQYKILSDTKYSWNYKPSLGESIPEINSTGMSNDEHSFTFKYFDNKRIVYYDSREEYKHFANDSKHQRLIHDALPSDVIQSAPFNIVQESDHLEDFLTEKTYRTLCHGVIPLLVMKYQVYDYLQKSGFRFPTLVLDAVSSLKIHQPKNLSIEERIRAYDSCNKNMLKLIQIIKNNWSTKLINECIECGQHNQILAAKTILSEKSIPDSRHIKLYYSKIINSAKYNANTVLNNMNIPTGHVKYYPYISKFNHVDIPPPHY